MSGQTLFGATFSLFCGVLFQIAQTSSVHAQTAQQVARKAFVSTVLLVMEDANGQAVSLGSGFFVRGGEIATNYHVVQGASRGYAKVVGQQSKYAIEGITATDPNRDLVLLKVLETRTPALSLGDSDTVEVGEPVYAVGNPQGLEGTFSQGIVSSVRTVRSDKLLQITAPISPGSSGGPVLNSKGEVIGVSVATFKGGQNLNFAIPTNYLKALLTQVGALKSLAAAKTSANQRSIVAETGGRSIEGVVGSNLRWTICSNCGDYSFSLQNKLQSDIRRVYCLVVFYDSRGTPVDVDAIQYPGLIPAGLAKRVSSKVHGSVQEVTTAQGSSTSKSRVEFRVLDFQVAE